MLNRKKCKKVKIKVTFKKIRMGVTKDCTGQNVSSNVTQIEK